MKKYILTIICLLTSYFCYAQTDSIDYRQYEVKYNYDEFYVETGLGALIPGDDSNTFFGFNIEFGKYINEYFGVGFNFHYGHESEYKDELYFIGPKFRYRVHYSPRNILDMDVFAGLGYGCYRYCLGYYSDYDYYDDYYYDYREYENMNYIVPNIGVTFYLNFSRNFAIGFEPGFMWYISTDLNKSHSVGVWNLQGKLKFTF